MLALKSAKHDVVLGTNLQELRQARGLNQTELGRRLGVSLQQIQKYESGRDRMAASTAFRAAESLGVEIGALYEGLDTGSRRASSKNPKSPVLLVPLNAGPRSAASRKSELIDLIRSYQAIENASLRASVRQIVRRLAADGNASRKAGRAGAGGTDAR
ncbi:helix-turn-helix domain-containing protein [Hyphococcus luteus]|uniref:HTH cro/C1-type domain-containing protein n=1 Tax=Hyphococcus luteus TaxID=2058213 RepID=A0A2S7K4Z6_9PROT|nr:helix-turn-helix transcriptional regulator [Marinicaulis flavus]PQA87569.1 hypothetical protein CW354_10825 [Marinicaulis flavus]